MATKRPDVRALEARLSLPPAEGVFSENELRGLADPVRRWFRASISPGTPLGRAGHVAMHGRIKLRARWLPFRAREVLAPHEGFVWAARVGGVMFGSDHYVDGHGALDWRLLGIIPVVHDEGVDVVRSSAGRAAGEAVWLPTSLLPRFGVEWEVAEDDHLVARFLIGDIDHALHVRIDASSRTASVRYDRWGDPDETGVAGFHPFGMEATRHSSVGGISFPVAGRVGWHYGTDRWDEGQFFRYEIASLDVVADATGSAGRDG